METKTLSDQPIMLALSYFVLGTVTGVVAHKCYTLKHTPEETIKKLEAATAEKKAAEKSYNEKYGQYRELYDKLVSTKKAYQDEIRPELESKIRKEFEDYISKADETYEKAKHENELASLKLELIKQYRRDESISLDDALIRIINSRKW